MKTYCLLDIEELKKERMSSYQKQEILGTEMIPKQLLYETALLLLAVTLHEGKFSERWKKTDLHTF